VFDCRRGTTGGEDVCWTEVEYGNVMQHVKKWMEGIHRWNAVFLLTAGIFFDESMQTRLQSVPCCEVSGYSKLQRWQHPVRIYGTVDMWSSLCKSLVVWQL
jgi:hypothetical protein